MDMKQWLPPKARLHSAVRHRPVQAFVYRMPTRYLQKNWLAELRAFYSIRDMMCGAVNSIPQSNLCTILYTEGKIARRRPDEPPVHAGRVLTHDQLLQWVWGPEKTGQPWLVREVV